jgi:hypothetical protein
MPIDQQDLNHFFINSNYRLIGMHKISYLFCIETQTKTDFWTSIIPHLVCIQEYHLADSLILYIWHQELKSE